MGRLLDTQQRVVFRDTFTPGRRARLDLADAERDCEVCNDRVLCLTAAMGDHDTPAIRLSELCTGRSKDENLERDQNKKKANERLNRLGDGSNLVDLYDGGSR